MIMENEKKKVGDRGSATAKLSVAKYITYESLIECKYQTVGG